MISKIFFSCCLIMVGSMGGLCAMNSSQPPQPNPKSASALPMPDATMAELLAIEEDAAHSASDQKKAVRVSGGGCEASQAKPAQSPVPAQLVRTEEFMAIAGKECFLRWAFNRALTGAASAPEPDKKR
jgi:hypothetical protein